MQQCNKECAVFSRINGYFVPLSYWSKIQIEEYRARKPVKIPKSLQNIPCEPEPQRTKQ